MKPNDPPNERLPGADARTGAVTAVVAQAVAARARPVLDAFHAAVAACADAAGREAPFMPALEVATVPGPTRYDPARRAVVLVPYEVLDPARRAAMDRFAAIGTLGLTGPAQYAEVFHDLLVAHELGHWLQEVAQRPLTRWQAEVEANRMMVAFWREHPAAPPAAPTARRLANFVAQAPTTPSPVPGLGPDGAGVDVGAYFDAHVAEIERSPAAYAWFQKLMVRRAMAEDPAPGFCQLVAAAWPGAR